MGAAGNAPLLKLACVSAVRDGAYVLRDLDLLVHRGDGWLVSGGNGAGKSALLALLGARLWPAPGRGRRAYDFGRGWEYDAVAARDRVALVGPALQQDYFRFDWDFLGLDVVLSGVQRAPVPQRRILPGQEERASMLLAEHGFEHLAARRMLSLSSGEQRVLLILRAVACDPDLLLIDEVFESLDARRCAELAGLLRRLHGSGTTLVVAQPEPSPALSFLTQRLHLRQGRRIDPPPRAASAAADTAPLPAPQSEVLLELRNVSVRPEERRVLHQLNWRLHRGERWLLRGPNGSGKSTLLRLLHGEFWPERGGELRWRIHRPEDGVWALRRRVRLVSPRLQTHDRNVMHLSHGELRRVLLARMLAGRPELLLLDEPHGPLDADARRWLHDALTKAVRQGATLVMASHETQPAPGLFTHQMTLQDGRLTAAGPRPAPDRTR